MDLFDGVCIDSDSHGVAGCFALFFFLLCLEAETFVDAELMIGLGECDCECSFVLSICFASRQHSALFEGRLWPFA